MLGDASEFTDVALTAGTNDQKVGDRLPKVVKEESTTRVRSLSVPSSGT